MPCTCTAKFFRRWGPNDIVSSSDRRLLGNQVCAQERAFKRPGQNGSWGGRGGGDRRATCSICPIVSAAPLWAQQPFLRRCVEGRQKARQTMVWKERFGEEGRLVWLQPAGNAKQGGVEGALHPPAPARIPSSCTAVVRPTSECPTAPTGPHLP